MKRIPSVLLAPLVAAWFLAGCGLVVPDIDLASWFGFDGTIADTAQDSTWKKDSSAIDRGTVTALGRGGITLSGLSIAGGTATDTQVPTPPEVAPAQFTLPVIDTAVIRVYLSTSQAGLSDGPPLLGTLTVGVTGADGIWTMDPADATFTVGSPEALAILNDAETFYSRVEVAFLSDGQAGVSDYEFTIDDLTATIESAQ